MKASVICLCCWEYHPIFKSFHVFINQALTVAKTLNNDRTLFTKRLEKSSFISSNIRAVTRLGTPIQPVPVFFHQMTSPKWLSNSKVAVKMCAKCNAVMTSQKIKEGWEYRNTGAQCWQTLQCPSATLGVSSWGCKSAAGVRAGGWSRACEQLKVLRAALAWPATSLGLKELGWGRRAAGSSRQTSSCSLDWHRI